MSTIGGPSSTIAATATTVSTTSSGTAVKMTFPGKVNRFHVFPTTVMC